MQHKEILQAFNNELKKKNIYLKIICVGGFVLELHGMRSTQDIDAFYNETPEIRQLIKKVGDSFGIDSRNELWLNHSVQNLNESPPSEICEDIYRFSHLTVAVPPLEYIAGMKIISGRKQDVMDAAMIITALHIDSPQLFIDMMYEYGLNDLDDAVLMDAFGMAYGMEWMEKYYREHESEILSSAFSNSIPSKMHRHRNSFRERKMQEAENIKNPALRSDYLKYLNDAVKHVLRIPTQQSKEEAFVDYMKKRLLENHSSEEVAKALAKSSI